MAETFCTISMVKTKAGANFPTGVSDAEITIFINEGEAILNGIIKTVVSGVAVNLVTDFASQIANLKEMLQAWCACYAANCVINNDMSVYSSLAEANSMKNWNYTVMKDIENLIFKTATGIEYVREFNT